MSKLDLEGDNVFFVNTTVAAIRLDDGPARIALQKASEDALDNAQGHVFSGEADVAYVVIKVTR